LDLNTERLAEPTFQTVLRMTARPAGAARGRQRELWQDYDELQEAGAAIRSQRDPTKAKVSANMDWQQMSEDRLYVHKRADVLGKLLAAKRVFQGMNCSTPAAEMVRLLRAHPEGERAVATALAEVRKAGLSSQIADLSVCGAVAPYNELIGGSS
jgi:methionine synthase I (cobalamin-dependent)